MVFFLMTNGSGITVRVDYRWLTPSGEIKEGEFFTKPFSATFFTTFPLYEGWLLSFAGRITLGYSSGTWCFLQAFVARQAFVSIANPMHSAIWQGFIYNSTLNGWPGTPSREMTDGAGVLRSIVGTLQPVGTEILETVPPQRRWNLLAFRAGLTTSATVANRFAGYLIDDGTNVFLQIRTSVALTASNLNVYEITPGNQFYNDTQGDFFLPAPTPVLLKAGYRIRTGTNGLQAGDQWSAPLYLVQEWGEWDD